MGPSKLLLPRSSEERERRSEMLEGMPPARLFPLRSSVLRSGSAAVSSVCSPPASPRPRSLSELTRPAKSQDTPRHPAQTGAPPAQLDSAAGSPRLAFQARSALVSGPVAALAAPEVSSRTRRPANTAAGVGI